MGYSLIFVTCATFFWHFDTSLFSLQFKACLPFRSAPDFEVCTEDRGQSCFQRKRWPKHLRHTRCVQCHLALLPIWPQLGEPPCVRRLHSGLWQWQWNIPFCIFKVLSTSLHRGGAVHQVAPAVQSSYQDSMKEFPDRPSSKIQAFRKESLHSATRNTRPVCATWSLDARLPTLMTMNHTDSADWFWWFWLARYIQ